MRTLFGKVVSVRLIPDREVVMYPNLRLTALSTIVYLRTRKDGSMVVMLHGVPHA